MKKKVKITATITAIATVNENYNGDLEFEEMEEILDVEDFEVIREIE